MSDGGGRGTPEEVLFSFTVPVVLTILPVMLLKSVAD